MREKNLSHDSVLEIFRKVPHHAFRVHELVKELGLRSNTVRHLQLVLKELVKGGKVIRSNKGRFMLASAQHRVKSNSSRPGATHAPRYEAPRKPTHDIHAGHTGERNVATGRLVGHRDGYGFVVPDQPLGGTHQDVFIPRNAMGPAMHGDRVEVQVIAAPTGWRGRTSSREKPGRVEGRILRVLDRAQKTVVGEFRVGPRYNSVFPFDHRIPFEIIIPHGQEWPAEENGPGSRHRQFGGESEGKRQGRSQAHSAGSRELDSMIVDVEITNFPAPGSLPRGRVIELLGRRDDFGVDVEIIIRKFHLPHRFPPEALSEASKAPQFLSDRDRAGRRDFRALPIVTIDGESAKDFDDAVYVELLASGNYLLQVHIADVAHYVRPGMALDREARLRGTSVYFPDRAVPMLPLDLSNGICSLNPHVERLVLSALMEIDSQGRTVACELAPGVIRSAERMTYTAVRDILAGERVACERYHRLVSSFRLMEELARILTRHREQRGSIDFDLPEPEIEFDEQGRMIGVTRSERNIAHRIIEEFMLAANETVAGYLEREGIPTLYRVHEKPDPKKILEFEAVAATFGYSLGIKLPSVQRHRVRARDERERYPRFHEELEKAELEITPHHYQRLTKRLEGKPEERILSYMMLRSLKQARYAEENLGHFALAAKNYTHFTSPIRRYPDLVVHRILKSVLERKGGQTRVRAESGTLSRPSGARGVGKHAPAPPITIEELRALALETSEAERRAQDAERDLMDLKKVAFMAQHVGDEFDALVISLIKHGFFVELIDLFVEGFVPLASFDDDRYVYRERERAVMGQKTKKTYRLGDRVRVRLDRIERTGNKLEFSVVIG